MAFSISSKLLDAMVLSVIQKEDSYGYKITQEIADTVSLSESTLYPVLRRLQKDDCLYVYDREYLGRNRRYYSVTAKGSEALFSYRIEWAEFSAKIDKIMQEKEHLKNVVEQEVTETTVISDSQNEIPAPENITADNAAQSKEDTANE